MALQHVVTDSARSDMTVDLIGPGIQERLWGITRVALTPSALFGIEHMVASIASASSEAYSIGQNTSLHLKQPVNGLLLVRTKLDLELWRRLSGGTDVGWLDELMGS